MIVTNRGQHNKNPTSTDTCLPPLNPAGRQWEKLLHLGGSNTEQLLHRLSKHRVSGGYGVASSKSALRNQDALGHTLLENLHSLATRRLLPVFEPLRGQILEETIYRVAHPGISSQRSKAWCKTEAIHFVWQCTWPSEYVRVLASLCSPQREARLANGRILSLDDDALSVALSGEHAIIDAALNASLMEYGNGQDCEYDAISDCHVSELPHHRKYTGLFPSQGKQILDAIFPTDVEIVHGLSARRHIEQLCDDSTATLTIASIRWKDDSQHRDRFHAVTIFKMAEGRVFFRNSHGGTGLPLGTMLDEPERRVEHPWNGSESMEVEEFQKRLQCLLMPRRGSFKRVSLR